MSLREIIKVPNPFLKVTAKPVTVIDEDILTILDDMMETMYHANGIGLAATQIAIDKRLIVMDCGKTKYETKVIPCKTIRDKNNVALSSRNSLLNKSNLNIAANIYKNLEKIKKNIKNKKNISKFLKSKKRELISNFKIKIDYLELRDEKSLKISKTNKNSRLFIAYYLNNVRLIDNL